MADKAQAAAGPKDRDPLLETDTLKADIDALRAELAMVVKAVKNLGANAVATAKRQQDAAIDRLSVEATSLGEEIVRAGKSQAAEMEDRIRAQPLAAVGVA